ncbi:MAG: glycosyltransferase [Alphaproteobacteria bacterium]|nr:glycosyltransferase [Alphaproteobacteria bacterium]
MTTDNKKPVFSLITVTLNNLEGLKKTYESIDEQTSHNFEWIVIDGASTDGTSDFLIELQKKHDYLLYSSEEDEGIYQAMNDGIKAAKGQYLLFLNAGDKLASPKVLEKLQPLANKNPDFIYGDSLEISRKDTNKTFYKPARRYKNMPWGMITHHQSMLYSRKVIRDHKLLYRQIYSISSDYDFTLRFLNNAKKITAIPAPICIFEPGGISQKHAFEGRRQQFIIRENLRLVSQAENVGIFLVQSLVWHFRSLFPALYEMIKSTKKG